MSDLILCDGISFLNAYILGMTALVRYPRMFPDLVPMAMNLRIVEANMIEADEETIATDPIDLAGMEVENVLHGETVMQESYAVVTGMNDTIAVLVHHRE